MERYLSIREAAEKWGVSDRRINQYCSEGRIPGAERIGKAWVIPADAEKPGDPRKQKKPSSPHKASKTPELFPGHSSFCLLDFCLFLPDYGKD